jgi:hypothetical protein
MPLYDTQCSTCLKQETRKLSFQQYENVTSGVVALDCQCGGKPELVFDPSAVSFVLKDGEGGGWVTKAQRENRYRAVRRDLMTRRERDHVKPKRLIPNYNGQVASSWGEAKDAAYQSTYARVNREHGAGTAARAASEAAKTYDTHVKREAT